MDQETQELIEKANGVAEAGIQIAKQMILILSDDKEYQKGLAKFARDLYHAYIDEGFLDDEAMSLVQCNLSSMSKT